MCPEPLSESERLARAISETRRLLNETEILLDAASGAFIRRGIAFLAQSPHKDETPTDSGSGEITS